MTQDASSSASPVAEFCDALRKLRQASGADPAALARQLSISRTQLYAILSGDIKRPPDWDRVVGPLVAACTGNDRRAIAAWRQRHAVLTDVVAELRRRERRSRGTRPAAGPQAAGAGAGAPPAKSPAAVRPATGAAGTVPPTTGAQPAASPAIRSSLPPDTAAFTGRLAELDRITAALTSAARPAAGSTAGSSPAAGSTVVAIRAIDGMPGVGKTTLAVRAAHLLSAEFPDRQLFIDLHGHTPGRDPVTPEAALAELLVATGADARFLPDDLAGRSAMWRDRMAGEKALLVLDNAASSHQVTPLLPGSPGTLVLVTSRRHLADLPGTITPVLLQVLPPGQAREMFLRLAPRAGDSPPVDTAELVRLAGYLPLAISLLARVYNRHPTWTLTDLATETRTSLLTLAAENDSIAAAFDVSWQHLTPGQQGFLRRLSLHPGATADAHAAAALGGVPLAEAARLLDALHGEGLLTETGYRRYGMHDLIRRYAADRAAAAPAADRGIAVSRLLDYYQHAAGRAGALLTRQARPGAAGSPPAPAAELPALAGHAAALAWARAERASMLACLRHAAAAGQDGRVVALTAALAPLLRRDGPWADAVALHDGAAAAARRCGDQPGLASALADLGTAASLAGDYARAAQCLSEALALFREAGCAQGEANALAELGTTWRLTGDYAEGAAALEQALAAYTELGDRQGQAFARAELGCQHWLDGDYPAAIASLEQALAAYTELGDRQGQASALTYLGSVRQEAGATAAAAASLAQALGIFRELGDRHGRATVLRELGLLRRRAGEYAEAGTCLREALAGYRELGSAQGQANALLELGVVARLTGDHAAAQETLREALDRQRGLGSRLGEANALRELAAAALADGRHADAVRGLAAVLAICTELGDRLGEAETRNLAGQLALAQGDPAAAREHFGQALEGARQTGSPREEASALAGLGRCARASGDPAAAAAALREAAEIFRRIGDPGADDAGADLAGLASDEVTADLAALGEQAGAG